MPPAGRTPVRLLPHRSAAPLGNRRPAPNSHIHVLRQRRLSPAVACDARRALRRVVALDRASMRYTSAFPFHAVVSGEPDAQVRSDAKKAGNTMGGNTVKSRGKRIKNPLLAGGYLRTCLAQPMVRCKPFCKNGNAAGGEKRG